MQDGNIAGQRFFFVGVGGSGMMPLAMILAMTVLMGRDTSRQPDPGRIDEPVDPVQHR